MLTISKQGLTFVVDDLTVPGSPLVGRGKTMLEAIGAYFHANQSKLNLSFNVHESAQPNEDQRRKRELAKR